MNTLENPPAYRDRRTGLIVFGIVEIIIGCFCLLLVLMMLLGQVMAAKATGASPPFKLLLPSLLMYPAMAAGFVWLGIGSMKRRRWARAISLIVSWSWLLVGIVSVVAFLLMAPAILKPMTTGPNAMPEEVRAVMMVTVALMLGVMFIIIPGALMLFYRSPHVKATCEAADPQPGWTDACPLPVLAASLWMFFGGLMMPLMPIAYNGVFPFFGKLVQGAVGTVVFFILMAVWIYAARAIYRLKPAGWWLAIISFGLLLASNVVTFWNIDIMEMYRAMGYSEDILNQIRQLNFSGRQFVIWTLVGAALIIGYFLFIYRYFRNPNPMPPQFSPTPA
jgi:hypothetical protein